MNRLVTLLMVIALTLIATWAEAQIITVVDQSTSEPLFLVTIGSQSQQISVSTDLEGKADISSLKDVTDIQISYVGYQTISTDYEDLESKNFRIGMKQSSITLGHVVISATRWAQSSSDIPAKIANISAEQVALQNPQTAADLLTISGKVFMQKSQQGGGSPIIRGFSTNRLLYTVDGVRMNTAIFRSGNLQNVISLDPFAIENTEVLFGPGSVIYGSDAIGGVMSFKTLTPRFSTTGKMHVSGKAIARYSSANSEKTGHIDVNIGWEKWASVTSISNNNYDDLRMGAHGPDDYLNHFYVVREDDVDQIAINETPRVQRPSGFSQLNLMQKLRFRPNEHWDLEYGFHYSATTEYDRYDRHQRMRNGLPRYAEWKYGPQKWMMNNLSIAHSRSNVLFDQMTLRLAHQFFEESRISRNFNDPVRDVRTEQVDALSANLDFMKKAGSRNTIYYGIEGIFNNVVSTGLNQNIESGVETAGASRYPQATWATMGAYISDQFKITEKLTIEGGLRYSYFEIDAAFDTTYYPLPFTTAQLNNGSVNGSIGLNYHPTEKWVLSMNGATGFRAPNVDDIGKVFDSEPGAVVVPNPNLQSEYAYNIDAGVAKIFGDVIKADLTGYYTLLQNALVRRDYQLNGQDSILYDGTLSQVQAVQNAAMANVYGVQVGLEIKLPLGFGFTSDFNYQYGEEETDDGATGRSRHAPPWFGISRLTHVRKGLTLQLNAQYSGEVKFEDMPVSEIGKTEIYAANENGKPYSPAWYSLNFKARYLINTTLAINAGIENLTNRRYRPYSSGISAPGRNFMLSLTATF